MDFDEIKKEMSEGFFVNFFYIMVIANTFQHFFGVGLLAPRDIYAIIVLSGLISLVDLTFYSKRELRRLELIIRHIISLFLGIAVVLSVASFMGWMLWSDPISVIAYLIMAVIGFIVSVTIDFFKTKVKTDEMTKKIKELNK